MLCEPAPTAPPANCPRLVATGVRHTRCIRSLSLSLKAWLYLCIRACAGCCGERKRRREEEEAARTSSQSMLTYADVC
jgi:hypothetical protein